VNALRRRATRASVQATLAVLAFFARRPALAPVCSALTHALAQMTVRSRGIRPAHDPAELGRQWQRAFPSSRQVPIERIDGSTVFAQIHTPCPLRGSGDLQACHRMMAFDRRILERAGGQFIVLESQASPGVAHCRVAMRMAGERIDDLRQAHQGSAPASR
jgi:hypothetical protein